MRHLERSGEMLLCGYVPQNNLHEVEFLFAVVGKQKRERSERDLAWSFDGFILANVTLRTRAIVYPSEIPSSLSLLAFACSGIALNPQKFDAGLRQEFLVICFANRWRLAAAKTPVTRRRRVHAFAQD
ncbi:MAG: hypothetical protein J6B09_05050, partial [Clostridia bacterium]|nr:hypothetical protein [Clostridia bacterium]